VDDPGLVAGADGYVDGILPLFDARGVQLSVAIVTGYDLSNTLISKFQSWIAAGRDVFPTPGRISIFRHNRRSRSSTRDGSAATMTIAGTTLTTAVTGGPGREP